MLRQRVTQVGARDVLRLCEPSMAGPQSRRSFGCVVGGAAGRSSEHDEWEGEGAVGRLAQGGGVAPQVATKLSPLCLAGCGLKVAPRIITMNIPL